MLGVGCWHAGKKDCTSLAADEAAAASRWRCEAWRLVGSGTPHGSQAVYPAAPAGRTSRRQILSTPAQRVSAALPFFLSKSSHYLRHQDSRVCNPYWEGTASTGWIRMLRPTALFLDKEEDADQLFTYTYPNQKKKKSLTCGALLVGDCSLRFTARAELGGCVKKDFFYSCALYPPRPMSLATASFFLSSHCHTYLPNRRKRRSAALPLCRVVALSVCLSGADGQSCLTMLCFIYAFW